MTFQKYLQKPMKSDDCASQSGLESVKISILAMFFNTFWSPVPPRDSAFLFYHVMPNHYVWEMSTKANEIWRLCLSEWPGICTNLNIRQVFQYFLISSSASRFGLSFPPHNAKSWRLRNVYKNQWNLAIVPLRVAWNLRQSQYSPGFSTLFDLQLRVEIRPSFSTT